MGEIQWKVSYQKNKMQPCPGQNCNPMGHCYLNGYRQHPALHEAQYDLAPVTKKAFLVLW